MALQWWSESATARWLGQGISYFTPSYHQLRHRLRWDPPTLLGWNAPAFSFSILDDLLWSVVSALESVVLVSMLCFFFLFCGCKI